jgi:hypothetical protein
MNLPEQELFTMEDVAARWNKPLSYVQDVTRRGLLLFDRGMIRAAPEGRIPFTVKRFISLEGLAAFERKHSCPPLKSEVAIQEVAMREYTIKEYVDKHKISDKTVRRLINNKAVKAEKRHGHWIIFE